MPEVTEEMAREEVVCRGCGNTKEGSGGQIVCWSCWKTDEHPYTPFKYFHGTFAEWLIHVEASKQNS